MSFCQKEKTSILAVVLKADHYIGTGHLMRVKALLPKLCLYIPYIQNYFMSGSREQSLEEMLNILSETTRVRRRPNVNTIIDTIKNSLDYEF